MLLWGNAEKICKHFEPRRSQIESRIRQVFIHFLAGLRPHLPETATSLVPLQRFTPVNYIIIEFNIIVLNYILLKRVCQDR
jgi:hypothetical protein